MFPPSFQTRSSSPSPPATPSLPLRSHSSHSPSSSSSPFSSLYSLSSLLLLLATIATWTWALLTWLVPLISSFKPRFIKASRYIRRLASKPPFLPENWASHLPGIGSSTSTSTSASTPTSSTTPTASLSSPHYPPSSTLSTPASPASPSTPRPSDPPIATLRSSSPSYLELVHEIRLSLADTLSLSNDVDLASAFSRAFISSIWLQSIDRLNLFYVLEHWALSPSHKNKTFIVYGAEKWTFQQAYHITLRYAAWFKARGIMPHDIVAIDLMNSDTFVWLWLSLWSLGAKPAFINHNLTNESLIHSARVAEVKLLVTEPEVYKSKIAHLVSTGPALSSSIDAASPSMLGASTEIVVLEPSLQKSILSGPGFRAHDGDRSHQRREDLAILIYTSGTTGLPKPSIISWGKIWLAGRFVSLWSGFRDSDVVYTCMPLHHSSAALLGMMACLVSGSTIAIGRRFSRSQFWNEVRASDATIIQYVGETCRYLLTSPASDKDREHSVRIAYGNGLRPDVWHRFRDRFGIDTICEFYGATEGPTAIWNKSHKTDNPDTSRAVGRMGLIARIVLHSSMAIVEYDIENSRPVRDPKTGFCSRVSGNQPGELLFRLRASQISRDFQGYYKNSGATEKKILRDVFERGDAWFSTGDVMRQEGGRLYFCDRLGDTFRWKSENVSTAQVAEEVGRAGVVADANVYGVEIPNHDGRVGCVAVSVLEGCSRGPPSPDQLRALAQHVRKNLPNYAAPAFLRWIGEAEEELPQNPTGASRAPVKWPAAKGRAEDEEEKQMRHCTSTNKQQKAAMRDEGVNPERIAVVAPHDRIYWLRPRQPEEGQKSAAGASTAAAAAGVEEGYVPFSQRDWDGLRDGRIKL